MSCYFPGHCHLVDIKRYLNDLGRTTVTDLGLVLGVLFPTMRDLPNDDFLNRVITLWLDKADSVMSKGEPSWRSLVQGLRDKQVRQNGIANSIAKDHFITDVQSQGMLPYSYCSACILNTVTVSAIEKLVEVLLTLAMADVAENVCHFLKGIKI